ncbi:TPA: hypothetical protein ACHDW3_003619, partial [Morganella morganii]
VLFFNQLDTALNHAFTSQQLKRLKRYKAHLKPFVSQICPTTPTHSDTLIIIQRPERISG